MVTIVDPHLKREENYRVYREAREKGLLVKNKDGGDFDGWCWPGMWAIVQWTCNLIFMEVLGQFLLFKIVLD